MPLAEDNLQLFLMIPGDLSTTSHRQGIWPKPAIAPVYAKPVETPAKPLHIPKGVELSAPWEGVIQMFVGATKFTEQKRTQKGRPEDTSNKKRLTPLPQPVVKDTRPASSGRGGKKAPTVVRPASGGRVCPPQTSSLFPALSAQIKDPIFFYMTERYVNFFGRD